LVYGVEDLANRFRDPNDVFELVVVRDRWLTGFDAPSLHTMYVDKPKRGHGLMQAIARVNRVFRDTPGGLARRHGDRRRAGPLSGCLRPRVTRRTGAVHETR
jgi:hypothetical protein